MSTSRLRTSWPDHAKAAGPRGGGLHAIHKKVIPVDCSASTQATAGGLAPTALIFLLAGGLVKGPHNPSGGLEPLDEIASIDGSLGGFELLEFPESLRPVAFAPVMRPAFFLPDGICPLADPIIPITTH